MNADQKRLPEDPFLRYLRSSVFQRFSCPIPSMTRDYGDLGDGFAFSDHPITAITRSPDLLVVKLFPSVVRAFPPACSVPALPADTPANYVSSKQSCRILSRHVRASQS